MSLWNSSLMKERESWICVPRGGKADVDKIHAELESLRLKFQKWKFFFKGWEKKRSSCLPFTCPTIKFDVLSKQIHQSNNKTVARGLYWFLPQLSWSLSQIIWFIFIFFYMTSDNTCFMIQLSSVSLSFAWTWVFEIWDAT